MAAFESFLGTIMSWQSQDVLNPGQETGMKCQQMCALVLIILKIPTEGSCASNSTTTVLTN